MTAEKMTEEQIRVAKELCTGKETIAKPYDWATIKLYVELGNDFVLTEPYTKYEFRKDSHEHFYHAPILRIRVISRNTFAKMKNQILMDDPDYVMHGRFVHIK